MIITCYTQEIEILPYIEGSSREFAVTLDSLVRALSLSECPTPETFEYLDLGTIGISVNNINHFLFSVSPLSADEEVLQEFRERLAIEISKALQGDVGFLSFSSGRLRDSLNVLQGYFDRTGLDTEYPLVEIRESLFNIFCEFLKVNSFDPLLLQKDKEPLEIHEAWLLCLLEETSSEVIYSFVHQELIPDDILTFLQIFLKERLEDILTKIIPHVEEFLTPDETSNLNGSIHFIS